MAEENTIGLKIVAETDSFNLAIKKTKDNIKQLGANFKESVASLDRWSQSSEGLGKKIDSLNGEMSQYKSQMDATRKEIEKLEKAEGDHSKEIENKRKFLQAANTKYQEAQNSVNHYTAELAKAKQKEAEEQSSLGQLTKKITEQRAKVDSLGKAYKSAVITYGKNSKEAKNLAKSLQTASKELDETEQQAKQAERALDGLKGAAGDAATKVSLFGKLGKEGGKILKGLGLSVTALGVGFFKSASATRELRTNLGKLDTAFTTNGHTADDARETYETLYGILGDSDQATEAASLLASLTDNEKDLKKWTEIATGVFATFGDSLPIESLAEAANETAKTGEITGTLADALNWAGINQDTFQKKLDKCTTEAERQDLIQKTLTKTYGKASEQYKETNKDIIANNKAQAELSEKFAEIGAAVEPLITQFKEMGTKLLESIIPVVEEWMPKIQEALQWIIDNKDILIAGITGIGVAMGALNVANMIYGVVKAFKAFKVAQEGATLAQWLLNIAMSANPIGLVIAAVMGLVTAFVILWNKSEKFRNFWKGLWEGIKNVTMTVLGAIGGFFATAWEEAKKAWATAKSWFANLMQKIVEGIKNKVSKISGFFSSAWKKAKTAWSTAKSWFSNMVQGIVDGFKNKLNNIKTFFSNAWNSAKDIWSYAKSYFSNVVQNVVSTFQGIPSKIKTFFSNAWSGAKEAWSNVKSFFKGKLDDITSAFSDLKDKMAKIGEDMIKGLWNGIKDMTSWITGKLKEFSGDVLGGIKKFFHIESPSKVMRDVVGKNIAKGIAVGIAAETKSVTKSMVDLGKKTLTTAKKANGDYTAVGKKAIENYTKGINANAKDSIKAVKNLIDKQAKSMKGYSKTAQSEFKAAGKATLDAYTNAINAGTEKAISSVTSSITKITDKMQEQYDTVIDKQNSLKGNLSGTGDLFSIDSESGDVTLNNLRDETTAINKFAGNLVALKKKLPKGMMEELAGLSTDEGIKVTDKIKSLSKKQLKEYVAAYKARENAANNASKNYYAGELKTIKTNFNDKITATMKTLPDKLKDIGVNTMSGFTGGMKSQTKSTTKAVKTIANDIIKQFKKSLKIHSPSKETAEIGEMAALGVAQGINDEIPAVENSVNTVADTITDGLKNVADEMSDAEYAELLQPTEPKTESKNWFETLLDRMDEKAKAWSEGMGKYFQKVTDIIKQFANYAKSITSNIIQIISQNLDYEIDEIDAKLDALDERYDRQSEMAENQKETEIAMLDDMYGHMQLSAEEYYQRRKQLEQDSTEFAQQQADEKAAIEEQLKAKRNALEEQQFKAQQANSVAQALIDGAAAIMDIWAKNGGNPILAGILTAAATTTTATQIAAIKAQRFIPALATGGITKGATLAMIGENGKEAVMPLEKNTGWMTALAEKLNAVMQKDYFANLRPTAKAEQKVGNVSNVNNFTQVINAPKTPSRRELYRDSKNLLALRGI